MIDKNQTFEQFVWTCARAFGALVMMRDESLGTKIDIESLTKPSDHYVESIKEYSEKINLLENMTDAEKSIHGQQKIASQLEYARSQIGSDKEERSKIEDMIKQVIIWESPSDEHDGLKTFMLEQLTESIKYNLDEYYQEQIDRLTTMNPIDYYNQELEGAKNSLAYYEKAYTEELERCRTRKDWLIKLIESVGQPV